MSIKNYSRLNPYLSKIKERGLLTGPSSTKQTYHIVLEIESSQFPFKVGDSIGVIAQNDLQEVEAILKKLHCSGTEMIIDPRGNTSISVRDFLLNKANIHSIHTPFFKQLNEQSPLLLPENKHKLSEFLHLHYLLDLITKYPLSDLSQLTKLMPLLPRFYSIANSSRVFHDEIHLTVAYVSYIVNGRERKGIGSHFLCSLAQEKITPVPIYLQPSNHFTLPDDPAASIILVGPGTGIAPFRAFLQERLAISAPGRNWLFFGERNRISDFYYESFWAELQLQGRLRLDVAFSRDTSEKTYVQHKMYEQRKSLWSWLADGAYLYICGDAQEMAKDVDATLHQIVREEGRMPANEAHHFIKQLRTERRYVADVY